MDPPLDRVTINPYPDAANSILTYLQYHQPELGIPVYHDTFRTGRRYHHGRFAWRKVYDDKQRRVDLTDLYTSI